MSILYCNNCDKYIDTDFDAEHFDENEECYELEYRCVFPEKYGTNNSNNINNNLRNTDATNRI